MLVALCSASALAQSRLDSIQPLHEVEVVANRYREVIPAQKLEKKQLEALSTYSVADAIRYFSGIQVKDYGGVAGLKTVDIRSMGTNHMGVFYDGIQLGNAQNGQIDLGRFSMDNMEEVSLYNGQKSEIFQPAKDYGSSGSVYLRTRRPKFESGTRNNLHATFRTGSFGLANPSVLWEHKLADNISMSANAEYTYATGRYKFRYRKVFEDGTVAWDTTAVRENGDIHALRAEAGIFGYMDDGKWHAKAYFYDSERGIPGAIVNNVWKNSQRQWDRNAFVQGSFQKELFPGYDFMLNAKYANDYMRYLNPDTTMMYTDNRFWQQEAYVSVANKYAVSSWWDVSLSADYQWNGLDADLQDFVDPQRHTLLVAAATAFDRWGWKAQASVLGTFVWEQVNRMASAQAAGSASATPAAVPDDTQAVTPAVFLSYEAFRDFTLRAFYKQSFRMPTFNDLYYTDIGNIALDPERTTQYNLGAHFRRQFGRGLFSMLEARADLYFNQVKNKIIAVPKGNGQYRWMMMNIGYVEIRGLDLSARTSLHLPADIRMDVLANYTFQKAQDFTDPTDTAPNGYGTYGGQIAYIPWHSGSAVMRVDWKQWRLDYSFIYVGERYHTSANTRANYEQPWYTHDLGLGRLFRWEKWNLNLTLEVNNLFDQQYEVVLNYPMPGRNYKFIVKCMF